MMNTRQPTTTACETSRRLTSSRSPSTPSRTRTLRTAPGPSSAKPESTDIARKTAANIVGRLVEAQRYEEELERAAELAEKEALAHFESAAGTPMKQLADEEEMMQLDYELRASGK